MKKTKTNKSEKIFIISAYVILTIIGLIGFASASSLGTYKQNTCVNISFSTDAAGCNISSVKTGSETLLGFANMNMNNGEASYSFCSTSALGHYVALGKCDDVTPFDNDFNITSTGNSFPYVIPIFLLIGGFLFMIIGIYSKNFILGFISGALFISNGLYTMVYGFGSFADMYTRTIAFVSLGIGLILMLISSLEGFDW